MEYYIYSTKDNALYINSNLIVPDTTGMDFKEHSKAFKEAFKMSYLERLEKFCKNKEAKKIIKEQLTLHKGCTISEFSYA